MHNIFSETTLASRKIACNKCNWEGKATETEQEHLYLTDAIELYCPICHGYLGFVNQEIEG